MKVWSRNILALNFLLLLGHHEILLLEVLERLLVYSPRTIKSTGVIQENKENKLKQYTNHCKIEAKGLETSSTCYNDQNSDKNA
jgi:hypothetical protein